MPSPFLAAPPSARRLTCLYVLALSTIAGLSICGQLLVQSALRQQHSDSTVVNIAGRQRMLSQKIAKLAATLLARPTPQARAVVLAELSESLQNWQQSHVGLRQGDKSLGVPGGLSPVVAAKFAELDVPFQHIRAASEQLLRSPLKSTAAELSESIDTILLQEPVFLAGMDEIVFQLDREAQLRVQWLRQIETSLLAVTLLVLALEGLFIFRPAVRRIRQAMVAMQCVTDEVRAAKELAEQVNEHKTQFLANVSHELRSPLHVIRCATELIATKSLHETAREHLTMIDEASRTLASMVDDLLDLTRIESGQLVLHPEAVDLRQLLRRSVIALRPSATQKGLDLQLEIAADVPELTKIDPLRWRQIVVNLITNAIKFTNQGSIRVGLASQFDRADTRQLVLSVQDTGLGIAPAEQQRIFEKFYQVDGSARRKCGGSGLGLSICAHLVEQLGGRIQVASELGRGSTFTFVFPWMPVESEIAAGERPVTTTLACTSSLRVLVVDDVPINGKVLTELLHERGHQAIAVTSGAEALSVLRDTDYDIVLMDVQMPDMDGFETTRQIRCWEAQSNRPSVPIIAVTASATQHDQQCCHAAGMNTHLAKPFDTRHLDLILNNAIRSSSFNSNRSNEEHTPPLELDFLAALSRLVGRRDLLEQMITDFLESYSLIFLQLSTAIEEKQFVKVRLLAHRLKGQLDALGAVAGAQAADKLEQAIQHESSSQIMNKICELQGQVDSIIPRLIGFQVGAPIRPE